ncbi:MAG: universal stress protein [Prochlorococcaceae cyanobacterium]
MAMGIRHLLVATDGSEGSNRAVQQAAELAQGLGARLSVLHVILPAPLPLTGMGDQLDARTLEALGQAARAESERILSAAIAAAAGIAAERLQQSGERPHTAILAAAAERGCDLIVMASHGRRGVVGWLLGSETQRVLAQAPCPVLVVH